MEYAVDVRVIRSRAVFMGFIFWIIIILLWGLDV